MRFFAKLVGIVISLGLLLSLLLPNVSRNARPAGRRTQCLNHLRNIGIALQIYQNRHGTLPPACVKDAEGRPMHSWRALLLPYLDHQDIAELYRFDEPWDGPNNRKLHGLCLDVFRCPEEGSMVNETSYVAVTGPETIWGDDMPQDWSESASWDGIGQTIMIVETTNSGIHWLEPRDLPFSEIASKINSANEKGIASRHTGIACILFADGRARPLADNLPPATVRALLTVNGRDLLRDEDY